MIPVTISCLVICFIFQEIIQVCVTSDLRDVSHTAALQHTHTQTQRACKHKHAESFRMIPHSSGWFLSVLWSHGTDGQPMAGLGSGRTLSILVVVGGPRVHANVLVGVPVACIAKIDDVISLGVLQLALQLQVSLLLVGGLLKRRLAVPPCSCVAVGPGADDFIDPGPKAAHPGVEGGRGGVAAAVTSG